MITKRVPINMNSKRDYQRINVAGDPGAVVTIEEDSEKNKILDISDTGIRFLSSKKPVADEKTTIHITFPQEGGSFCERIKVVRCTKITSENQESDIWEISGRFVD